MPPKYSSRVNTVQGDMQTLEASEVGKLINKWLSFWSIDIFTMHLGCLQFLGVLITFLVAVTEYLTTLGRRILVWSMV